MRDQVAELKAKCSSMQKELSQRSSQGTEAGNDAQAKEAVHAQSAASFDSDQPQRSPAESQVNTQNQDLLPALLLLPPCPSKIQPLSLAGTQFAMSGHDIRSLLQAMNAC